MAAAKAGADAHAKGHAAHHDDDHGGGDHGGGDHGGGHCPPPWIITFADMVTLLMAFFVILLQTSKPDVPKFQAFASAMKQTFGTVPDGGGGSGIMNGGATILNWNEGPQQGQPSDQAPSNSPNSDGQTGNGAGDQSNAGDGGTGSPIAKALAQALQNGEITVDGPGGPVTVTLPENAKPADAQKLAETLVQALTGQTADLSAKDAAPPAPTPPANTQGTAGGDAAADPSKGSATAPAAAGDSSGAGGGNGGPAQAARMANIADSRLQAALSGQIANGDVQVQQRDGKVFVTVGAGGAFQSGSADMTAEAQQILEGVVRAASTSKGQITVTGHTDNVPISGGKFADNWDLAAGRAASVVRALAADGRIDPARLVATSKGDTAPVADNATEDGRAKNRRIEIEIDYGQGGAPPAN